MLSEGRADHIEPDLVSVIIPTYNRAVLLLQAISSVHQQTWPHIQIIVADDGSTDNTEELVSEMRDVVYVKQDHRGQGSARNLGLRHAKGEFIATLDSDDLWKPDFVENSVNALRTLNADFVFSNWTDETPDGRCHVSHFEQVYGWAGYAETELSGWRVIEPEQSRAIYMESCISPSSALLFPRELIADGWSENLKIGDDRCLLLSWVLSRPCRVAVATQPRWIKRVCGDNISYVRGDMDSKRYASIYDFRVLLDRYSGVMTNKECAWFHAKIAFNQLVLSRFELRERRPAKVLPLLLQSIGSMLHAVALSPDIIAKCTRELVNRKRKLASTVNRPRKSKALSGETAESGQVS